VIKADRCHRQHHKLWLWPYFMFWKKSE
jgi:hypothetical protein